MESAAEAIKALLQTQPESEPVADEREHYPGLRYSALAVVDGAVQQEHPEDTHQQKADPQVKSGRNNQLLTCISANADRIQLQTVTRGDQVMHLIWTKNSTSIPAMQASCMLALTAADAVLLYINKSDVQGNPAILLVLFQEKLKLVESSSWIGKQQTTLYIATQEPSLMSGNIIKAFLIGLWQRASGQHDDDSFAQHFAMHVLGLSHSRFQGCDGYVDDCFDVGDCMIEEGDVDKSRNPVATLLPADLHPCFVQGLWDQAQSMSDSVLLDTVAAMADEICQSAAEEQICILKGRQGDMCSDYISMGQEAYLPLSVLLPLVANGLDDAMQGYKQALAYRFPTKTSCVPKDRRIRHLAQVKQHLWRSAASQEQALKASLISMTVQHIIGPQQMSMKQCLLHRLERHIWAQPTGQNLGVSSKSGSVGLWEPQFHSNEVMALKRLQSTCHSSALAELDTAMASWIDSKGRSGGNSVSHPEFPSKPCEGKTFLQGHSAVRNAVRESCELYRCYIFGLHGWTVQKKHVAPLRAQLSTDVADLMQHMQTLVSKARSDLQMAALSALQPLSSELKAAIFDMASIPVTPMVWK